MLVLYNINSLFKEDNVILCLEDVLEGNQSLNITFKTWINKISTVSDFNSKDLITRKDLVHKSDREWSKDYSKLSGYCFYSSLKTFYIPPFIQLYSTLNFNRIIPSRSLKTIILETVIVCYVATQRYICTNTFRSTPY